MVVRLDYNELKALYKQHIKKDFPFWERRPLFSMKWLYKKGQYTCFALKEQGKIVAYAIFIHGGTASSVLLDYFAVVSEMRGGGVGSRFFKTLAECWDKSGVVIECERPEAAKTEEEKSTRSRRVDFYLRNGAEMTGSRWRLFGVQYTILWMPIQRQACSADVQAEIRALYKLLYPGLLIHVVAKDETPIGT